MPIMPARAAVSVYSPTRPMWSHSTTATMATFSRLAFSIARRVPKAAATWPKVQLPLTIALEAVSHTGEKPRATVTLTIDGTERSSFAEGDGPVDAVFKAIENEVHSGTRLLLFSINAITTGTDSQAEVMVRLERDARIVNGAGADTDIIVASAKAYLHALNVMGAAARAHPQIGGI